MGAGFDIVLCIGAFSHSQCLISWGLNEKILLCVLQERSDIRISNFLIARCRLCRLYIDHVPSAPEIQGKMPSGTKVIPNWVMAGTLATFCGSVYAYTVLAVGKDDLAELAQMEKEKKAATSKWAVRIRWLSVESAREKVNFIYAMYLKERTYRLFELMSMASYEIRCRLGEKLDTL